MKRLVILAAALAALAVPAQVFAADGVTLSGTATVQGDTVRLVSDFSDTGTANDFGAIGFPVPTGATLATLTTLAAEFNVTDDNCGGAGRWSRPTTSPACWPSRSSTTSAWRGASGCWRSSTAWVARR